MKFSVKFSVKPKFPELDVVNVLVVVPVLSVDPTVGVLVDVFATLSSSFVTNPPSVSDLVSTILKPIVG